MLVHLQFSSKSLALKTDVYVIKPDYINKEKPVHILYLLHGYTGDYTDWIRYTNIEKASAGLNLFVVMPSGYNTFYVNVDGGMQVRDYLVVELPELINETFGIKPDRDHTYIAGLSMGGYGALKTALYYPDKYKKVASFSAPIDINRSVKATTLTLRKKQYEMLFGDKIDVADDPIEIVKTYKHIDQDIYISCGSEDTLLDHNDDFHQLLMDLKIPHTYVKRPGSHTWDFWGYEIEEALKFFKLK